MMAITSFLEFRKKYAQTHDNWAEHQKINEKILEGSFLVLREPRKSSHALHKIILNGCSAVFLIQGLEYRAALCGIQF